MPAFQDRLHRSLVLGVLLACVLVAVGVLMGLLLEAPLSVLGWIVAGVGFVAGPAWAGVTQSRRRRTYGIAPHP